MLLLELRQEHQVYYLVTAGMAIQTRVCSATSGLMSSYDGYFRNLN